MKRSKFFPHFLGFTICAVITQILCFFLSSLEILSLAGAQSAPTRSDKPIIDTSSRVSLENFTSKSTFQILSGRTVSLSLPEEIKVRDAYTKLTLPVLELYSHFLSREPVIETTRSVSIPLANSSIKLRTNDGGVFVLDQAGTVSEIITQGTAKRSFLLTPEAVHHLLTPNRRPYPLLYLSGNGPERTVSVLVKKDSREFNGEVIRFDLELPPTPGKETRSASQRSSSTQGTPAVPKSELSISVALVVAPPTVTPSVTGTGSPTAGPVKTLAPRTPSPIASGTPSAFPTRPATATPLFRTPTSTPAPTRSPTPTSVPPTATATPTVTNTPTPTPECGFVPGQVYDPDGVPDNSWVLKLCPDPSKVCCALKTDGFLSGTRTGNCISPDSCCQRGVAHFLTVNRVMSDITFTSVNDPNRNLFCCNITPDKRPPPNGPIENIRAVPAGTGAIPDIGFKNGNFSKTLDNYGQTITPACLPVQCSKDLQNRVYSERNPTYSNDLPDSYCCRVSCTGDDLTDFEWTQQGNGSECNPTDSWVRNGNIAPFCLPCEECAVDAERSDSGCADDEFTMKYVAQSLGINLTQCVKRTCFSR